MNTLFLPELREMLAENNIYDLEEFCTALNPARTAEYMEGLDPAESWRVLRHADLKLREQIFLYLGHERQNQRERRRRATLRNLIRDRAAAGRRGPAR